MTSETHGVDDDDIRKLVLVSNINIAWQLPRGVLSCGGPAPQHEILMRDLKTGLKAVIGTVGRFPGVRNVVQHPLVRERLVKLPGSEYLYVGMFRTHPFDCAYGTDTGGVELPTDFAVSDVIRSNASAYLGSQPNVIRLALGHLPPVDNCTFLDLGCGKGRPLFVATEFPFRRIIGVELSPHLAEIAQRNAVIVAGLHPHRTPVEIVQADASTFALPPGNLVIFLYHPFGYDVMAKVVASLEKALLADDRSIYVVYYNPVAGRCFDESPSFRRRFGGMLAYAPEEKGYGLDLTEDPVVIWQGGASAPAPTLSADIKIVIRPSGMGVELVE